MRYEQVIRTWCIASPSGGSGQPQAPGPEWRMVGISVGSWGDRGVYGAVAYERVVVDDRENIAQFDRDFDRAMSDPSTQAPAPGKEPAWLMQERSEALRKRLRDIDAAVAKAVEARDAEWRERGLK